MIAECGRSPRGGGRLRRPGGAAGPAWRDAHRRTPAVARAAWIGAERRPGELREPGGRVGAGMGWMSCRGAGRWPGFATGGGGRGTEARYAGRVVTGARGGRGLGPGRGLRRGP